jgi:CpeT protein
MRALRVTEAVCAISLVLLACGDSGTGGEAGSGAASAGGDPGGAGGAASGGGGAGGAEAETAAARLYRMLTGHFDSIQQSIDQPAYFPIDLLTCPIEIPELGARLLHVEQSIIDEGEVQPPYRQRVYVITDGPDPATQAVSQVWEFESPEDFAGFCSGGGAAATAADLTEREGCQVEVTWMGDHFVGSTPGKECLSDLNGATYATSEVEIYEDRIESWDRGYDADDQQVWGATAGAYIFARLTPLPQP